METRIIKLIDGSSYTINLTTPELINHFNDGRNFTDIILQQFNELSWYSKYITSHDKIILDLGSNVGLFAIHASSWADLIIAVEPTPNHMELNKQLTSKFDNITRIQAAISDTTGEMPFYTSSGNTTMNSLIDRGEYKFMVETLTVLDVMDKFNLDRVDFIKMDIEGSEVIALNDNIIDQISKRVSKILIEFHEVNGIGYSEHRKTYEDIFIKYGYETTYFGPDGLFCIKEF